MKCLSSLVLISIICACYSLEIKSNNFAPPRGKLYGISSSTGLLLIDADTGSQTLIGKSYPDQLASYQLSSIDAKRNIYYIIAQNTSTLTNAAQLIGFDLSTGDIKVNVPLPFVTESFPGIGQFVDVDPLTGDVFATGPVSLTNNKHQMYRYVYQTKTLKLLATFDAFNNAIDLYVKSVYDAKNKIEFVTYAVNQSGEVTVLEGYDVVTGKLVSKFAVKDGLGTLAFDPTTGLIVGLGVKSIDYNKWEGQIVTLNGATGAYNVVGTIPNSGEIIDPGLSALDYERRILYLVLSKEGSTDHLHLVGVNVDTAKVVSQAELGTLSQCPLSIEFKPVH